MRTDRPERFMIKRVLVTSTVLLVSAAALAGILYIANPPPEAEIGRSRHFSEYRAAIDAPLNRQGNPS
jgi:hypothetical protein